MGNLPTDGANVVIVGEKKDSIYIVSLEGSEILRQWRSLDSQLRIDISPDGKCLATGSGLLASDQATTLLDYEPDEFLRPFIGHDL